MMTGDQVLLLICLVLILSFLRAGSFRKWLEILKKYFWMVMSLGLLSALMSGFCMYPGLSGEGSRIQYGWPHFFAQYWISFDHTASNWFINPVYVLLQMGFYASTLLLFCILWELRRTRSLRVRFGGWKDDAIRAKHFGSFNVFEIEVSAGREIPRFPIGVYAMRLKDGEVEGIGTPEGARIDVEYDAKQITVEEIKKYLETMPIKFTY